MVDVARLGVVVDPRDAQSGARAVNASMDGMSRKAQSSVGRISGAFGRLKRDIFSIKSLVGTLFVGLGTREVINSTRTFGQAIADLQAITGAAGADLAFIEQKSRDFGATTTLSASQSAEAFKLIASAKPDLLENVQALAAVTEETIRLSEASGVLLPDAARTVGLSLNQFSADASEAARFVNVLAAGSKFGASEVANTGAAIEKSGVVARIAGASFEELNALIQILAANGLQAQIAGTQLRGVLLSLQKAGGDLDPKIHGVANALRNAKQLTEDSTRAIKVFGRENVTAASILAQNADEIEKLTRKLTDTQTATEQQSIRTDTLNADMLELRSTYEEMLITIGDNNQQTLRGSVQALRDMIREATDVIDKFDLLAAAANATLPLALNNLNASLASTVSWLKEIALTSPGLALLGLQSSPASRVQSDLELIESERKRRQQEIINRFRPAGQTGDGFRTGGLGTGTGLGGGEPTPAPSAPGRTGLTGDAFNDALKESKRLFEALRTPGEEYRATLRRLNELRTTIGGDGKPLISLETYNRAVVQAKKTQDERNDALQDGIKLTQQLLTPQELHNQQVSQLNQLREEGAITQEVFTRAIAKSTEEFERQELAINKQAQLLVSLKQNFADAFAQAITDGQRLSDVMKQLARDIAAAFVRQAFLNIITGGKAGFIPSFAHGGSFIVGGKSGTDKNFIGFNASRGEEVQIRTPGQQRQGEGGSLVVNIYAPGADEGSLNRMKTLIAADLLPQAVKAARDSTITQLHRPLFS